MANARSAYYRDNSRYARAELTARPATAPAFFLGRPATVFLARFRKSKSR